MKFLRQTARRLTNERTKKRTMSKLSPAQKKIFQLFKMMRKKIVIKEAHSYGGGLRHAIDIYKRLTTGEGYDGKYPGLRINLYQTEMKELGITFNKRTLWALKRLGYINTYLKVDSYTGYNCGRYAKTYYDQTWYITMTDKGLKVLDSIA